MGRRTGSASLPLHGGRVPAWLGQRMQRLGRVIAEAIVHHYGNEELLRRLAHPFWFQSFGSVMGMDWHSSGITTSVIGALKRGLEPVAWELGVHVCGGRGRHSRRTPDELLALSERLGIDGDALGRTSRLVAKVDSSAIQDGFQLYLHSFIVSSSGSWTVIQQGMNTERREARRYHWLSSEVRSFVEQPHTAIDGPSAGEIINLTDLRAQKIKACQLELIRERPEILIDTLSRLRGLEQPSVPRQLGLPHLALPAHHDVRESDVVMRRLRGVIAAAHARAPEDFSELLLTPGIGPRTVLALTLVSELLHGTPCRFSDPARFSMALGGKDGHPFPVPLRVYDETIRVLKTAMHAAPLARDERLEAIRRLDVESRRLEGWAEAPGFDDFIANEKRQSASYGGTTVSSTPRPPRAQPKKTPQLSLLPKSANRPDAANDLASERGRAKR